MTKMNRVLIWAKHTRKWEIAHQEETQWIRDDMSSICFIGQEIAQAPLPAPPQK